MTAPPSAKPWAWWRRAPTGSRGLQRWEPRRCRAWWVADPGQDSVQSGLVKEPSHDDRLGAVVADLEAAEPSSPPAVKDAVHADLVIGGPPGAAQSRSPQTKAPLTGVDRAARHARISLAPAGPVVRRASPCTAIAIPPVSGCVVRSSRYEQSRFQTSPEGAVPGESSAPRPSSGTPTRADPGAAGSRSPAAHRGEPVHPVAPSCQGRTAEDSTRMPTFG
jgi:hypothetical protein